MWVNLGLGDKDRIFALLDQALSERFQWLLYANVWSVFDPLRDGPRFKAFLHNMNLAG